MKKRPLQKIVSFLKKALFILLILSLPLAGYLYYEFVWRGETEPATELTFTSSRPIHSEKDFWNGMRNYEKLYRTLFSAPKSSGPKTYALPGLLSTKTLAGNKAQEISICTSMTPQGIAVSYEYIFVSAYCHTKEHNSVIYVIDKNTGRFVKEIVLPGKPHAGSLAYDDENDILWVCGSSNGLAQANAIAITDIYTYSVDSMKKPIAYQFQNNLLQIKRSSFMTYKNRQIYIGFFHSSEKGILNKYRIEKDGNLYRSMLQLNGMDMESGIALSSSVIPKRIQGMAFYYDKLFLSQSFGILPSYLILFDDAVAPNGRKEYDSSTAMLSVKLPAMLEQVYVFNDELYLLFEAGAYAYRDLPTFCVDRILTVNIGELKQLVADDLQEARQEKIHQLRMKREIERREKWEALRDYPWISETIDFYTLRALPEKKNWLFFP